MELQTSRILGIIGALLMVLTIIPSVGVFFMLVGVILVLIALKGYADIYKENSIFLHSLYTVVFVIIGAMLCMGVIFYGAMGFLSSLGINSFTDMQSLQSLDWPSIITPSNFLPFLGTIVLGLVILFAFFVIASLYFKKAMNALSTKTNVKLFHTTGTVFFVGALLTIIFVGIILIWISFLLLLIAFYESKPTEPMQQPQTPDTTIPK
jgi:uncharacterized membrane protein